MICNHKSIKAGLYSTYIGQCTIILCTNCCVTTLLWVLRQAEEQAMETLVKILLVLCLTAVSFSITEGRLKIVS